MERLISLFFILIITGCGVDEPLYDYDVEEKILNMGYAIPEPSKPIATVSYTHLTLPTIYSV